MAPGILVWQAAGLAFAGGVLALENFAPALAGLALLGLACRLLEARPEPDREQPLPARRFGPAALAFMGAAFLCGWMYAGLRIPQAEFPVPDWITAREKVRLTGRVDEVASRPDRRLRLTLSELRIEGRSPLPGRMILTWERPAAESGRPLQWPVPGERLEYRGLVKTIGGFRNPGGFGSYDGEAQARRQGVAWRGWASRSLADSERLPEAVRLLPPESAADARIAGVWRLRESVRATIQEAASPQASSNALGRGLLAALALGDQFDLPGGFIDVMRRATLAHSLALSGQNVAYVVALAAGAAWLLGRLRPGILLRLPRQKLTLLLGFPLAAGYAWLGLGSPSLLRALFMFAACGLLLLTGRARSALDGLFLAGLALAVWQPLILLDAGFQLSVLAVAGILVFFPLGRRLIPGLADAFSRPARDDGGPARRPSAARLLARAAGLILLASVCAQAGVLPLASGSFGTASPHLWLNAVWLPLVGLGATPLGLAGLLLSWLPAPVSEAGAFLLSAAATLLEAMAQGLLTLERAGWLRDAAVLRPHWTAALGYYALLAVLAAGLKAGPREGSSGRRKGVVLLAAVGLALMLGPAAARNRATGEVRLTLIDVGHGQAALLESPTGVRVLVDGGGTLGPVSPPAAATMADMPGGGFDVGEAAVLPTLTGNRPPFLDRIILTHPDADHLRGLIVLLRKARVGAFHSSGVPARGTDGQRLAAGLKAAGLADRPLAAGDVLDMGGGAVLRVLHPPVHVTGGSGLPPGNETSLVLRLEWNGRGLALLPGDLGRAGLSSLLSDGSGQEDMSADALVLPHHGLRSGFSSELYARVDPRLALASCESLGRFQAPHPEVRAALAARGCPVETTAASGQLRLTWAGPDAAPVLWKARGN